MSGQEFVQCTQCTDAVSGKVGSFVSETMQPPFRAVSPVFGSLADLFPWMRENGYKLAPAEGKPSRVVKGK